MAFTYRGLAWIWQRLPGRVQARLRPLYTGARYSLQRLQSRRVPLDRLLMGDQCGIEASLLAELLEDPLYPSTPVSCSPHLRFLQTYLDMGEAVLEPSHFYETAYYRFAAQCMDIVGEYFEARNDAELIQVARRFIDAYQGQARYVHPAQSHPRAPVQVRPVRDSDYFQVIDGHHRLAILHLRGERTVPVFVYRQPVHTPLQSMLLKVLWQRGRRELYQPIPAPEVQSWTLVRRCTDRLAKMRAFLQDRGLMPPNTQTYLDLGASYGWFVAQMAGMGFRAWGVEREPTALRVGQVVYGLRPEQVIRANLVRFLEDPPLPRYDVVSLFSVLHHFVMGRGGISGEALIRRVDALTGRVLFLDTGQNHEAWFRDRLPEWDVDFIQRWLSEQTSFDEIVPLGPDEDAVPPFQANYGRMLFACVRH